MAGAGGWAVPAHKQVPGTRFVVDGFRHAHPSATAYFLTHAHSDHYQGLSERWDAPVYCTDITARLIRRAPVASAREAAALRRPRRAVRARERTPCGCVG